MRINSCSFCAETKAAFLLNQSTHRLGPNYCLPQLILSSPVADSHSRCSRRRAPRYPRRRAPNPLRLPGDIAASSRSDSRLAINRECRRCSSLVLESPRWPSPTMVRASLRRQHSECPHRGAPSVALSSRLPLSSPQSIPHSNLWETECL